MKIGVLCYAHDECESLNLASAIARLDHQPVAFTLDDVDFEFTARGLQAHLTNGFDLRRLDLIISRANLGEPHAMVNIDRYHMLCELGVPLTDPATPFLRGESKLATMAILAGQGIAVPRTRLCRSYPALRAALAEFGEAVIKPSFGYGGAAVEKYRADADADALHRLLSTHNQLLVQEYIPHPEGDFRVTTCGEEVLFVARRIPNAKTWKANVSLGADMVIVQAPPQAVSALGLRVAKILGLFMSGVDILPSGHGYIVLEANNCPGWSPLPAPVDTEIALDIVRLILGNLGCDAPDRGAQHSLTGPCRPKCNPLSDQR